jgi:hypothetical protein
MLPIPGKKSRREAGWITGVLSQIRAWLPPAGLQIMDWKVNHFPLTLAGKLVVQQAWYKNPE